MTASGSLGIDCFASKNLRDEQLTLLRPKAGLGVEFWIGDSTGTPPDEPWVIGFCKSCPNFLALMLQHVL